MAEYKQAHPDALVTSTGYGRTTDNAAGQGVPSTHRQVESPATSAEPVPAAPTPCPWTDIEVAERGIYKVGDSDEWVKSDFARSLERLCRQQQEKLTFIATYFVGGQGELVDAINRGTAAYAAMEKECNRG